MKDTISVPQNHFDVSSRLGQPNHIGVIVSNFEATRSHYETCLGLDWAPTQSISTEIWVSGELLPVTYKVAWSVEGPVHIEFIERVAETPFAPTGVHHFGYWVEDLDASVERLKSTGMSLEVTRCKPDGSVPFRWAYMMGPSRLRVELMDAANKESYQNYLEHGTPLIPGSGVT